MARGIIYLITNKENGCKYVGQTTQGMNKEWQRHIQEANRMSSEPLHRAFRQYGVHKFGIKEIDECDASLLNEKEAYWIEHYDAYKGYNTKPVQIKEKKKEEVIVIPPVKKGKLKHLKSWSSLTNETRGNGKHCGLRIRGKNLTTGICTDYENARVAAEAITGHANRNGNILLAARKYGTAYGHRWQILEEKTKKKAVFGVNKKTELIEVRFESIAAAARAFDDKANGAGIRRSLKNPGRFSWKGYYWFLG